MCLITELNSTVSAIVTTKIQKIGEIRHILAFISIRNTIDFQISMDIKPIEILDL